MPLYESLAPWYDDIFPLKQKRLEFVRSFLDSGSLDSGEDGLSILDIGCATGSLALALGQQGHRVTGIDLDRHMIAAALEKNAAAKARGDTPACDFKVVDMTRLGENFSPASFDAILCFGNTLAHLQSPGEIETCLAGMFAVLKPRGILLLQVVNFENKRGEQEFPVLETEQVIFRRRYCFEKGRVRFITALTPKPPPDTPQRTIENVDVLYPLGAGELRNALENTGFSEIRFFGDEEKRDYTPESPALIALARGIEN